jgi:nucleoid DNA-binding protein
MCRIRLSEEISKHQQLKKKSAATALNTVLASAHIQTA